VEDLRVFPDKNIPKGALDRDGLVSELTAVSGAKLEADRPKDRKSLKRFRRLYSPALRHALSLYAEPDVEAEVRGEDVRPDCVVTRLVLRDKMRGAEIPAIVFSPSGKSRSGAVLMVHEDGKPGFLGAAGASETNIVDEFVKDGRQVMLIDCFETGEHVAPEKSARRSRSESPDESSDYEWSFTYNRTDTAERVYDILCALDYLRNARPVSVVGGGRAGLWCMLACAFAGKVDRVVCDTAGFDTSNDEAFVKDLDVPCLRKAGDFNTAIAMIAPGMMLIHNTQGKFDTSWVGDVYKATAQAEAVKVVNGKASDDQIIRWVLGSE
jgi:dienelactone hydrolase